VHQSPYREVKKREEAEQEEPDTLQHQPHPRNYSPVGEENEGQSGGDQQNARQVVGEGEANQKRAEQQVSAVAALSPEKQEEDD
jgi:hypothetical protein